MKDEIKWMSVRLLLVMVMLVMLLWRGIDDVSMSSAFFILAFIVVLTLFRKRHPEAYQKDERTVKLGAYGTAWSWMLTFVFVALLYWADYTKLVTMPAGAALGLVFFFMTVTMIAFRWYYLRKGDV
ncbi:MAG: hypothetical protein JW716_00265 [Candidatus Aenigmarchaeota archaeon]|nr:hypothetical protein [Candidatus Aenigmarchaeota archaeon]